MSAVTVLIQVLPSNFYARFSLVILILVVLVAKVRLCGWSQETTV